MAVYAVLAATVISTAHVPLGGIGAVGRLGLSLALAWLFWRTRRIWPFILVCVLWDILALHIVVPRHR